MELGAEAALGCRSRRPKILVKKRNSVVAVNDITQYEIASRNEKYREPFPSVADIARSIRNRKIGSSIPR